VLDVETGALGRHDGSFRELVARLQSITTTFDHHQWALAIHDLPRAENELARYRQELERFLDAERKSLLPLCERIGAEDLSGPVEDYEAECFELERRSAVLAGDLRHLRESPPPRGVNTLLIAEADYLVVATRHFLRTENRLLPALDLLTVPGERQRLLRALEAKTAASALPC
jgi:hypothetical protein